jgi:hypothetical protein
MWGDRLGKVIEAGATLTLAGGAKDPADARCKRPRDGLEVLLRLCGRGRPPRVADWLQLGFASGGVLSVLTVEFGN